MKVLFLDIDGVLNGHEKHPDSPYTTIRPDCVQRLNTVIGKTGCQLVISSAWRYMLLKIGRTRSQMTLDGFKYMLHTHGLKFFAAGCKVIGHTQADEICTTCNLKVKDWNNNGDRLCTYCNTSQTRGRQIRAWLESNARNGFAPCDYAVVDDIDLGIRAEKHPFVQTDGAKGLQDKDVRKLIRLLGKAKS